MGGVRKEEVKKQNEIEKYNKRPEKLKSARDTFERLTGRKARPVEQAGMFKDMTALENQLEPQAEERMRLTLQRACTAAG